MKRDGKILPGNRKKELWKGIRRNYCLYLFLLPAVVFIGVFCYAPMYGVLMAFQDYSPGKGILGSPWVGLKWFRTFFELPRFWQIVKNTLVISLYSLVYVWSGIWQNMGWSSIIYLAALSGVDQELHEAAMVDGASKLKRIIHIDLPAIIPTMVILLIMNAGSIMSVGYEKVYLMQNDLNVTTAEVISTYVYKIGLKQQQYSYSAAIGLFNNLINFILLVVVNKLSKKLSGSSLW